LVKAIDDKYHKDFDVIQFEFGKVAEESHKQEDKLTETQTYINSLKDRVDLLEKRVIELEKGKENQKGELPSGEQPRPD
jgi:septal ring factor EnvC (AmiA/AmiB activator)